MIVSVILKKKGSADVMTVAPTVTVAEAAGELAKHRIGALVVSPDGRKVAGIISERDIVRRLGQEGAGVLEKPVSEVMTAKVETCRLEDTTYAIVERMTHGRFRHLPVLDGGENMIGLLSIGDVVKARLEEIEAENAAMVEMLSS
ncbi:MAG TPA: CBS domain-containing protein [Paracoccaceae bacterium]|nr:CBS domain-containing protein [Paracoccaceae bacterium]